MSAQVEKKGQFNYLSWPYAVSQLRQFDPTATWQVQRFDGLPFLCTENGTFVEVAVTVKEITLSQIHPVLDSKNRPIPVPNTFDINTSIQRCLVKAIALHGLGLGVYSGEDLPNLEAQNDAKTSSQPTQPSPASTVREFPKRKAAGAEPELLTVNQLCWRQLLPGLYEGFNPMSYDEACDKEVEVGIDLRSAGFGVWQA